MRLDVTSEVEWRPPRPQRPLEAIGYNMHMDTRVIKVADVKSEVI